MSQTIELPENLTIHYATEHMAQLKSSILNASDTVNFDLSNVETVDTSGIQLVLLMLEILGKNGIDFEWVGKNAVFVDSVSNLGLASKFKLNS
jgi:anti-anti-sigma regulatory factor